MFINLTPHPICIRPDLGVEINLNPDPRGPARVASVNPGFVRHVDGVAVKGPDTFGEVNGLPDPEPGVYYIVSALVGGAVRRPDVLTLGTGPDDGAIRDNGRIVAVTCLKFTR